MASQQGRKASTTSASPPIMIESFPSRAPTSPPETGASMLATPCCAATSGNLDGQRRLAGRHVDDHLPASMPANTPSGPRITLRTSAGNPTIEKTTSDCSATALGVSAQHATSVEQVAGLFRCTVVDGHRESGVDQVPAHAVAHHAGADPADSRCAGCDFRDGHRRLSPAMFGTVEDLTDDRSQCGYHAGLRSSSTSSAVVLPPCRGRRGAALDGGALVSCSTAPPSDRPGGRTSCAAAAATSSSPSRISSPSCSACRPNRSPPKCRLTDSAISSS